MRLGPIQLQVQRRPVSNGNAPEEVELTELGSTNRSSYEGLGGDEYLPELRGHQGIRTYKNMKRSDAQVRASLRVVKMPIISAQWYVQPASDDPLDREVADFVWWNLNQMRNSFVQFLWEALLCLDYGHYVFEKVWDVGFYKPGQGGLFMDQDRPRERPVVRLAKLAPRPPLTLHEWVYDDHGDAKGVWHTPGGRFANRKLLPLRKLLVFTTDFEAGDMKGFSLLRTAYKHWYYKDNLYKVDAIQKERHGIGIPIIKLPPGYKTKDKQLADEMGENLRTNERAHITLPPGWALEFATIQTHMVDVLESAIHHGQQIFVNVLAEFLNLQKMSSSEERGGLSDIFIKTLRYFSEYMRGQLNHYLIPQLVDYNYIVDRYPQVKVRRIGENADWRALSVALRNMIEPGLITPDSETEVWLRDQMDFPVPSKEVLDRSPKDRILKEREGADAPQPGTVEGGNSRDGQRAEGAGQSGGPTE